MPETLMKCSQNFKSKNIKKFIARFYFACLTVIQHFEQSNNSLINAINQLQILTASHYRTPNKHNKKAPLHGNVLSAPQCTALRGAGCLTSGDGVTSEDGEERAAREADGVL